MLSKAMVDSIIRGMSRQQISIIKESWVQNEDYLSYVYGSPVYEL